jgi:hypothetical protein
VEGLSGLHGFRSHRSQSLVQFASIVPRAISSIALKTDCAPRRGVYGSARLVLQSSTSRDHRRSPTSRRVSPRPNTGLCPRPHQKAGLLTSAVAPLSAPHRPATKRLLSEQVGILEGKRQIHRRVELLDISSMFLLETETSDTCGGTGLVSS